MSNYLFAAANLELIVQPDSSTWPLASTTYRVANISLTQRIPQDTPAQAWRREHFGTILLDGDAAWNADWLGDGLPNPLKYALNGNPTIPSSTQLPTIGTTEVNERTRLTFTFQRIADPSLTYEVWASSDLVNWGAEPIWSSTGVQNIAGGITVTDPVSLAEQSRRFLRLKVIRE